MTCTRISEDLHVLVEDLRQVAKTLKSRMKTIVLVLCQETGP